jgi:hypothetical protein
MCDVWWWCDHCAQAEAVQQQLGSHSGSNSRRKPGQGGPALGSGLSEWLMGEDG